LSAFVCRILDILTLPFFVLGFAFLFWMIGERRRDVLHGPYVTKEQQMEAEVTKKVWDDPQLDAAQFAIDRFLNAKETVSEQMSKIYQSIRDGSATDEDRKRLKNLREQYIALSREVEDVMGRLLIGKHLHHS
jgi:arylsulfatase A-like enzyme